MLNHSLELFVVKTILDVWEVDKHIVVIEVSVHVSILLELYEALNELLTNQGDFKLTQLTLI